MDDVELAQGLGESAQPKRLFPAACSGNVLDQVADAPDAAGAVRERVKLVGGGGVAENGDVDLIAEAAVDLIGPAGKRAAIVRTELFPAGKENTDFEQGAGGRHPWSKS